jgi:hypothetical protein
MDDFFENVFRQQTNFHNFIAPIRKLEDYSFIWITKFYTIHKFFYGTSENSLHLIFKN